MGWGEDTKASDRSRIESLEKRMAELEDQVAVLVVVTIGALTTMRTTTTLSSKHAQISALLDALAPAERN